MKKLNLFSKKKKKNKEPTAETEITEETVDTEQKTVTDKEPESESITEETALDDNPPKQDDAENDNPPETNTDRPANKKGKRKTKKKRKFPHPFARAIYWFWGAGPPTRFNCRENPFGAYSFRGKLKRWYYVKYRGYCYSITTLYDVPNDVYLYDKELIPRRELSDDSVHVTNEKNTYHLDLDHPKRGFDATKDFGFTAHDAYMYIRCNKIDEAMKIELGEQTPVDYKKLFYIVIGVAVAFFVFYFMYMQR